MTPNKKRRRSRRSPEEEFRRQMLAARACVLLVSSCASRISRGIVASALSMSATAPQQPRPPPRTFYRRTLPPTSISFSSPEGKAVFAAAMAGGGAHSFFPLIEQLQTQPEPAYCGLTTLVIVLNGPVEMVRTRYEERMLNCCIDLEQVKKTGITLATFACLARCQGLDVSASYGSDSSVSEFRRVVKSICTAPPSARTQPSSFLVVSYNRSVIGQTGTGHFSPVGAYDEASDHVLVLDTARFKYGPHWVPLELMFEALLPLDPDTGRSRGYAVLTHDGGSGSEGATASLPLSVLFGSKKSKDFLRREYKRFLRGLEGAGEEEVTLSAVVSFWTKDGADGRRVWELVEPQLRPVDAGDVRTVESVRRLLRRLIEANGASDIPREMLSTPGESGNARVGECCDSATRNAGGRLLEISPGEAVYVVYLASLPADARRGVVYGGGSDGAGDEGAGEQLLAEAALISFAIEMCDADV